MAWNMAFLKKNALHALVGGIMSELTGNGFLAGASASAVNEMVQKKLSAQFAGEPDKHQWACAIIGGIVLFIFYYIDCSLYSSSRIILSTALSQRNHLSKRQF